MKRYHAITLGIILVNFSTILASNVVSAAPENNFEIQGMRVQISGPGATENEVRNVRDRVKGPWLNHLLEDKHRMNQIDATSQAEICPICLDEIQGKDLMLTPCNHVFCSPCITQALDNQQKCPACRRELVNSKELQPFRYTPGEEVELALEINIPNFDDLLTPEFAALGVMYEVEGLMWSGVAKRQGFWRRLLRESIWTMNYEDATRFCRDLGRGARLPTREEYRALKRVLGGQNRYNPRIISDMVGNGFWSSSVDPDFPSNYAYEFNGSTGVSGSFGMSRKRAVRCILPAR